MERCWSFFFGYEIVHCGFLLTEGVSDILFGVCHQNIDFPPYIPKLLPVFFHFLPSNLALKNSRPPFSCNKKSSHIHTTINFKKKRNEVFFQGFWGNFRCCWNFRVFFIGSKLGPKIVWGVGFQFAGWSCCHGAKLWSTIATQHLENVVNWHEQNVGFLVGWWFGDGGVFCFQFFDGGVRCRVVVPSTGIFDDLKVQVENGGNSQKMEGCWFDLSSFF